VGQRIKERRTELGIGPGELMDKLQCTIGMVNHYETGKHLPTLPRLIILAKTLKCSTDELLGLKPWRKPYTSKNDADVVENSG
jgi:transcriptional regulator with XRE-family HTH domain